MDTRVEDIWRTASALIQSCWEDTGVELTDKGEASWAVSTTLFMDLERLSLQADHVMYLSPDGPQHVIVQQDPSAAGDRAKTSTNLVLCGLPVYRDRDIPAGHLELRWARRMEIS